MKEVQLFFETCYYLKNDRKSLICVSLDSRVWLGKLGRISLNLF